MRVGDPCMTRCECLIPPLERQYICKVIQYALYEHLSNLVGMVIKYKSYLHLRYLRKFGFEFSYLSLTLNLGSKLADILVAIYIYYRQTKYHNLIIIYLIFRLTFYFWVCVPSTPLQNWLLYLSS